MITYKELVEKWLGAYKHKLEGYHSLGDSDARKYGNSLHDPVELHPKEKTHLNNYSDVTYGQINSHLRHGTKPFGETTQAIKHISNAINKHTTKKDIHVWRNFHDFNPDGIKKGDVYHDSGFVSTSIGNSHGQGNNHTFHIKIPKGSKALYLNQHKVAAHPMENEVLLQKGARFKYHGSKEHTYKVSYDRANPTRSTTIHHMTYLGSDE